MPSDVETTVYKPCAMWGLLRDCPKSWQKFIEQANTLTDSLDSKVRAQMINQLLRPYHATYTSRPAYSEQPSWVVFDTEAGYFLWCLVYGTDDMIGRPDLYKHAAHAKLSC